MDILHYLRLITQRHLTSFKDVGFFYDFLRIFWTQYNRNMQKMCINLSYKKKTKHLSSMSRNYLQWLYRHESMLCIKHAVFYSQADKGLTCWQHNDRHKEMQTSSFLLFDGHENTKNENLHDAPMPLRLVRSGHKGQNWKASAVEFVCTDSGFCFWLMEQEIQTRRLNSVLKKDCHRPFI